VSKSEAVTWVFGTGMFCSGLLWGGILWRVVAFPTTEKIRRAFRRIFEGKGAP
jgi:hypothetical protein